MKPNLYFVALRWKMIGLEVDLDKIGARFCLYYSSFGWSDRRPAGIYYLSLSLSSNF